MTGFILLWWIAPMGVTAIEQAAAASYSSTDQDLLKIGDFDIRRWLLKKCYPDCVDMDAIEGLGTLIKLTENCGGKK